MIENYDKFIKNLKKNRMAHWARMLENSGCKIIVAIDDMPSEMDEEYTKWCLENCNDSWFVYNENYVFFDTEEDAMAFKLRWL